MKLLPLILMLALFGCGRNESPDRKSAHQAAQQILGLVPVGTPLSSARQILEQHQFTCTVISYTNKEAMLREHLDALPFTMGVFRDGKIQSVTNVSFLDFKNKNAQGRLTIVNDQTAGESNVLIR